MTEIYIIQQTNTLDLSSQCSLTDNQDLYYEFYTTTSNNENTDSSRNSIQIEDKGDFYTEYHKNFQSNIYEEEQTKKNEGEELVIKNEDDEFEQIEQLNQLKEVKKSLKKKDSKLVMRFFNSEYSINTSSEDNNSFINNRVIQEKNLIGSKRERPISKTNESKKVSKKLKINNENHENIIINDSRDNSTIKNDSEKSTKRIKKEKKFQRLDEPFKGIKSTSFKALFLDEIKKLEKKRSKSNWNIISNMIKNFRLHFIVNVKKNDNREYLNMSIKEIITHIYEVKIQKAIEFLQGNITRNGKPLKNQKKRDENIKFYEESLDLFNMAEFNFDTLFSEKSRIILDKTYFDIINEFKESNAMKIYLQKITKSQTGQFVKNFNYILKKFKVYLGNKNENKIRRTFYNRDEIILENQEDNIIIEEEEFENEEYSTNGLSHSFSQ